MKIKSFILSLRGKAIIVTTFFVVVLMALGGYTILSREKALYLKDRENQVRALIETAGINFTNAILYQEVGLIEETGVIDHYITDLLKKEGNILTVIIFDNTGKVIAHCHLFEHGKFYSSAKDIIENTATIIREVKDKEKGPILEAITPLMVGTRRLATLRIEFSLKDFYEKLSHLGKRIILMTIFAISGSILLIVLGFNAMTGPLRRLARDMDNIDYGRYAEGSHYEGKRGDEIGVLQRSFSSMVRRLNEADIKWENTFNSITDLLSIHDRDYRVVKANNALARRLHTTPETLVGRHCWEVYHNSNGICPGCPHTNTLETGRPSTIEKEYLPLGGVFHTTTFPYFNEDGEIIGTVHIAKDVTDEKRLQEKLFQSEKMAAMGQLVAGVAHEINNPLNSILAYSTYLLEETSPDTTDRDTLQRMTEAALRCKGIVGELLDFARKKPPKMAPTDINIVIEKTLNLIKDRVTSPAHPERIEVIKGLDPSLSRVMADETQLEQVFLNIILNAYQAISGGGRITLKTFNDGQSVKVKITDTGCGIPEGDLMRIFDPFFTTKEPGKGTGLGLAVSHNIIDAHGGSIDVESKGGEGTTFTITLPVAEETSCKERGPYE